jgi:4-amino-4-deoxy-L-arabinose transferase-like glycosyltransferase
MQFHLRNIPTTVVLLLIILAVSAGWKALLLGMNAFSFNADEAVVGLMARHILQGERPIFFYGQAYMGSLDAFLVAGGFILFGQSVWVIRLVQTLLYLGLIITTIGLGKEIFGSWKIGLAAGGLMAVPSVNMTLYTTASLGGYGEALLIGNLILLLTLRIASVFQKPGQISTGILWGGWGLLTGLGLWANGLTLIYSAPSGILLGFLLVRHTRDIGILKTGGMLGFAICGFLVGAAPWWIYAFSQSWQSLFGELLGGAVAVEQEPWVVRTFNHFISFILLGGTVSLGFRPPWDVRWLAVPLLPFVLMGWAGIFLVSGIGLRKARGKARTGGGLMLGVMAALAAGFILTSFGVDPSGRYFLPYSIPLSLAAGYTIFRIDGAKIWKILLFCVLIVYQGWSTIECALINPPGLTTQFNAVTRIDTRYQDELIQFLRSVGETRGYTNYWVAYPTAFLSQEGIILSPQLPYHADLRYTARDNRYLPYDDILANSETTAYITTHNPALDEKLVLGFQQLGVSWQEKVIGDYRVYYHLTRAVRPVELSLGNNP